jgi:hypothetical protein
VRFAVRELGTVQARRLVTVPSYEDRFVSSLARSCDSLQIAEVIFVRFTDYLENSAGGRNIDPETSTAFRANYARAEQLLKEREIEPQVLDAKLDDLIGFSEVVESIPWEQTAVDISTMPRSYILTMLRCAVPGVETIIYTQGKNRRECADAFAIGVRDIITLPGFEGRVGHRPTLLAMSIGYEGARAYSLFRRYEPTLTVVFLGEPRVDDIERNQILRAVRRNNRPLLDTDGVYIFHAPSYEPNAFAEELIRQIDLCSAELEQIQGFPVDIVLSPVGTKPHTLGLFSVWRERPGYQIAYAVPTIRHLGTVEAGSSMCFTRESY